MHIYVVVRNSEGKKWDFEFVPLPKTKSMI